jgi:hypothetical protein
VTADKTCIRDHDPEYKKSAYVIVTKDHTAKEIQNQKSSAGKAMSTVFWSSESVVHTDFLEKGVQ